MPLCANVSIENYATHKLWRLTMKKTKRILLIIAITAILTSGTALAASGSGTDWSMFKTYDPVTNTCPCSEHGNDEVITPTPIPIVTPKPTRYTILAIHSIAVTLVLW